MVCMTEEQVRTLLVNLKNSFAVDYGRNYGTETALAAAMRISPQYLNDVLRRGRSPGPKILDYLGLEKRVEYVTVKKNGRRK